MSTRTYVSSKGISAQSVGGGGGTGGAADAFSTLVDRCAVCGQKAPDNGAKNISLNVNIGGSGGGNADAVTVENTGRIMTEGAGGHGIFAHSVGGGGVAGSAGLSPGSALFFIGSTGDDGKVEVISRGDIYTYGPGAAVIFDQSGSGWEKRDNSDDYAKDASVTGKEVTVTVGARIDTSGINSKGAIAQSIGVNRNSDITVTVEADGSIIGGVDTDGKGKSSGAVGIQLLDGKDNQITNMGLVTT